MSATGVAVAALLGLAVLVDVLAVAGLLAMRTTLQRLHFVGPATCVAPVLAGIAVAVAGHATSSQGGKGLLIALVLLLFSGALSHETGRAAASRGS